MEGGREGEGGKKNQPNKALDMHMDWGKEPVKKTEQSDMLTIADYGWSPRSISTEFNIEKFKILFSK